MLIQWDINRRIVAELQRKHGDDYLGKEWDFYAEVGAAICIALAVVRKHASNRNQGAFLQAPVAWNVISPPYKVAIVSTYNAADLARGHEQFLEVLQAFTVKLEDNKEQDLYMLVNWLLLPSFCSRVSKPQLYQTALEYPDIVNIADHPDYVVIVQSSCWTCGYNLGDYMVYRIAKPWETRLASCLWTVLYQGANLNERSGHWILSKLFDGLSDSVTVRRQEGFEEDRLDSRGILAWI